MSENATPFPAKLKTLREKRGLSQLALGGLAGMTQSHVSKLEKGHLTPTVQTVVKLAKALGVPTSKLID